MKTRGVPLTIALTLGTAGVGVQALTLSPTSRLAPLWVIAPTLALLVAKLWRDLTRPLDPAGRLDGTGDALAGSPLPLLERRVRRPREARLACWAGALLAAVYLIGLPATVPLFLVAFLHLEADLDWVRSAALALGAGLGFHLLFDRLLDVPLPPGVWL